VKPVQSITKEQRAAMQHALSAGKWADDTHPATKQSLVARRLATRTGRLTKTGLKRLAVKPGRQPSHARLMREAEAERRQLALDLVQGT
jgi:hypothetical protein